MVNKHTKRKRAKEDEKNKLEDEEFLKLPSDDGVSKVIYIGTFFFFSMTNDAITRRYIRNRSFTAWIL